MIEEAHRQGREKRMKDETLWECRELESTEETDLGIGTNRHGKSLGNLRMKPREMKILLLRKVKILTFIRSRITEKQRCFRKKGRRRIWYLLKMNELLIRWNKHHFKLISQRLELRLLSFKTHTAASARSLNLSAHDIAVSATDALHFTKNTTFSLAYALVNTTDESTTSSFTHFSSTQ